jgi:two-component system, chemotaxis family, protein-glutamate methylesterase/glutaminase
MARGLLKPGKMSVQSVNRDIICIGASTGGVLAVKRLLSQLPADLPAAVFAVQHQGEASSTELARILGADSPLVVKDALHGENIVHGRVYVAPSDNHLLVREGRVDVVRSARENGHRPAVNPLFRTAANTYQQRVIAVVLTGALDCGTAGLITVKARGGVSVAQDPDTAVCPDMPANAIRAGLVDHVASLENLPALLIELTRQESAPQMSNVDEPKPAPGYSFVTCPHCHGSLQESNADDVTEFECHVGHKFSLRALYSEQADQVEFAMWAAIRALEESSALAKRMSDRNDGMLRARFLDKERTMKMHADTLREMVLAGNQSTRHDVADSRARIG